MSVIVAIDAGTTGVRAFALRDDGTAAGISYTEFTQHFPRPGWVEHDALEIWRAIQHTLSDLTSRLTEPIAAVGITDQRETVVAWDRRTGQPLHRAIVWQDRRTAERCDALNESGFGPLVRRTTGLVVDPYFSATKFEWLLTEGGVAIGPDLALGTIDSWILWNLTGGPNGGVHATEPSNASRTMLLDIRTLTWSAELSDHFSVPTAALPEVRPSSGRFGVTAAGTGLPTGLPVSGMAGDQQAALFGQACLEPGMTKNTYGTGSFVLMNVGTTCPEPAEGLLTTVAWTLADGTSAYALEGAIFSAGSAVQWLRDALGIIDQPQDIEALAASVPDSGGCYIVPAFTGLGSPWWDPHARGTIMGITRGTNRAHLARAVLQAISLQTRDVVRAMSEASGYPITALKADGGAAANNLLLQLQADDLQVAVSRPVIQETTAMGSAYLAGLAEGVWDSPADISANWKLDATFTPTVPARPNTEATAAWQRAIDRSRGGNF
ncbi:MAG: glycerol kinase [Acidimicrobiia bacterium]|nr:glycerol kinase [Acidimicrobiia bacterium]